MSNKCYAVLLVLAGMVCGILLVSLTSSPASAKLPTEERIIVKPGLGQAPQRAVPPLVARTNIRVYPAGVGVNNIGYAFVVKGDKLWYCEGARPREIRLR